MKVLVLGERARDIYLHTKHTRQSPEDESVPVLKVQETVEKEGMSSNVVNNLKALGVETFVLEDFVGITKTRVYKDGKQIFRIDNDSPARDMSEEEVIKNLKHMRHLVDAVVVEDYGKGFFTPAIYKAVFEWFPKTFVDTSPFVDFKNYRNCYLLKPNLIEAQKATGETDLRKMFNKLYEITNAREIVVTASEQGMYLQNGLDSAGVRHHKALSQNVVDVTGCGDTVISALTYSTLNYDGFTKKLEFASRAAAVCVEKFGVYAPTLEEINKYGQ